jgi:hypothetical protein
MQTCRASTGHKNSAVVVRAFADYIGSLPRRNLTPIESKRLAEYEAVRDMAWDASYIGSSGVLRGVAGLRMLKQAEKDMVAPQAETAAPWNAGPSQRQRGSRPSGGSSGSQGRPARQGRVPNNSKTCYGCGDKGHVRRDCPKNKSL